MTAVTEARHALVGAVLTLLAESHAVQPGVIVYRAEQAREGVDRAALALVRAIDEAPPAERPEGWGTGPDGSTA